MSGQHYHVLARQWRPRLFSELIGQAHVAQSLQYALTHNRLHHAYLFSGTRGVGKTTVGRILAKALNCLSGPAEEPCNTCEHCTEIDEGRFIDLIEIDAASKTKVEDTRELLDNVQYLPTKGRYKVYLIDEVHMLSAHSFNALLKTLEEPPEHVVFLLATTDPQKLPVTVLSRCLQFHLRPMSLEASVEHMTEILQKEGVPCEPEALNVIAEHAEGSMRDALSLLDQCIAFGQGKVAHDAVCEMLGLPADDVMIELLSTIIRRDADALFALMARLEQQTEQYDLILESLMKKLHLCMLLTATPTSVQGRVMSSDVQGLRALIEGVSLSRFQLWYNIALKGKNDITLAPSPKMGLEVVLLRMCLFEPQKVGLSPRSKAAQAQHPLSPAQEQKTAPEPAPIQKKVTPPDVPAPQMPPPAEPQLEAEPASKSSTEIQVQGDLPNWTSLVEQLGLEGMARQFARHCALVDVKDEVLYLRADSHHGALLNSRIEESLHEALKKHFSPSYKCHISVGEREQANPVEVRAEMKKKKERPVEELLLSDPHVQYAKQALGAEVVPQSLKVIEKTE